MQHVKVLPHLAAEMLAEQVSVTRLIIDAFATIKAMPYAAEKKRLGWRLYITRKGAAGRNRDRSHGNGQRGAARFLLATAPHD
jgi:hypothetical protein